MYCHGWYALVKQVERHTKSGEKSNNYRKLHGVPLKRKITRRKYKNMIR